MGVQYSGSRFPSSVPRVSPGDGCPISVCRQGLYREAHSPPVTDTVHTTKQHCRGSLRHYISRVLQSPLPRDSPLHYGECGSIRRSLPRDAWVTCGYLFPLTHPQRVPKISSISESGHHIPIPGTAVWPFSSTLGIHQDYDRDQNTGTRDGHQCLSHLVTISRPVPPRHCTSAPHDGLPHSRQEVGTDPKTEIPFLWDTNSTWFPTRSIQLWIDITNQALICSFLLSQRGFAHTWQILFGLFAFREKMVPLVTAAQPCRPTLHLSTLGFHCFNQQLVDTSFPHGGGRGMVEVSTQCSEGSPSYPNRTRHSVFTGASNIGWGAHWMECIDGVWTTTKITLHINVLELEAIHRAKLHWLRKLMGLTVLVASDNFIVVSYINKQGGTRADGPRSYSSCVRPT